MEEKQKDEREHDHAEDLEYDPRVVDDCHQAHAEDVQQRRAGKHKRPHCDLGLRVVRDADSQVVEQRDEDDGHGHVDRGNGQDPGEEIDPAREPRVVAVGEVLGPLINGAGDREMGADLGEVERDDELTDRDEGPAPDESRTADPDAKRIKSEDAGRRRYVREGDREARVDTECAPELLLVAKAREITNVVVCLFLQRFPSLNLKRVVQLAPQPTTRQRNRQRGSGRTSVRAAHATQAPVTPRSAPTTRLSTTASVPWWSNPMIAARLVAVGPRP